MNIKACGFSLSLHIFLSLSLFSVFSFQTVCFYFTFSCGNCVSALMTYCHLQVLEENNEFLDLFRQKGSIQAHMNWLECYDLQKQTSEYKNLKKKLLKVDFFIKRHKELALGIDDAITNKIYMDSIDASERKIEEQFRPPSVRFNPRAVVNLTGFDIPEDILLAISFGYKFLFPFNTNDDNIHEILAQVEQTIEQSIPEGKQYEAYFEIAHILKKRNRLQKDPQLQWLTFIYQRTERLMKSNNKIFATKSDKGGHSVILTIENYNSKLMDLLNDSNYTKIEEDPLERLIQKETKFMTMLRKGYKTKDLTDKMRYEPNTLTLAKFYGLPKIHKTNVPLRPITATRGSPGFSLAKIFDIMLKQVFEYTDIHIKDSYVFKKFIDDIIIKTDDVLVSFDVVSMYTSIPISLSKDVILEKLKVFSNEFGIGRRTLIAMIDFLLEECMFFTASNGIYKQKNGLPMGSCISPTIARIAMDRIIFMLLKEVPEITFIKVYVDDTITAINKELVEKALTFLNGFLPGQIEFTIERENDERKINFLNMTLQRNGDLVTTNWHRKYFASGRLLNYFSSHKRTTVINTAAHFIKTVLMISDPDFFRSNESIIIDTLRDNSFPETTIIALMNECYTYMKPFFKEKLPKIKEKVEYRIFPHAICKSREIKRVILNLKESRIRIAESTKNTKVNPIKTYKTKIPIEKRTNLILIAKCQCGKKYKINRTGRNETGEVTARKIVTPFLSCDHLKHAYRDITFKRGLAYNSQTKHLEKYYRLKYKGSIDDHFFNLPVPAFAKLVPSGR